MNLSPSGTASFNASLARMEQWKASAELNASIQRLRRAGCTDAQICERLSVSPTRVAKVRGKGL